MNPIKTALHLAARGWKVFPCFPDKKPMIKGGYKAGTDDITQVRAMFANKPDALIGIAMSLSGLFAVDVDDMQSWRDLKSIHSPTSPVTVGPMQNTPRGGIHMIFKYPAGIHVPNTAGALIKGIDLRSEGYICTGDKYRWLDGHGPDTPVTSAPGWLLSLIAGLSKPRAKGDKSKPVTIPGDQVACYWLERYLPMAGPGSRNEIGKRLALQLRDSRIPQAEAESLPYPEKCPAGDHPYTRQEWIATVRSIYNHPAREPATLPKALRRTP